MPVFRTITGPIIRTPAQGADTIVWPRQSRSQTPAASGTTAGPARPITVSVPRPSRTRSARRSGATVRPRSREPESTGYDAVAYLTIRVLS
jgi:hypothetical protein